MRKRVQIFVSGSVQGVFFRGSAAARARESQIVGFARNLSDGRVEVVAEGEERDLITLIEWCKQGPPVARVHDVETTWQEPTDEFDTFFAR